LQTLDALPSICELAWLDDPNQATAFLLYVKLQKAIELLVFLAGIYMEGQR
jgi:hypothetical protein